MSVFPLWMIIKLYLIQLTSFEHLLDAVQLDVWDKHFICCSLFLLLSWYLLRVLKLTLASCSRAEWMPSNYPAQRLSLSTECYNCCYVRKHVFQLYSQFNCLILCVKYKAQSVYFSWVMVTEMNVLRVATFYPHLHCTCRPTQMWACGQDLAWNETCHWWCRSKCYTNEKLL